MSRIHRYTPEPEAATELDEFDNATTVQPRRRSNASEPPMRHRLSVSS